MILPHLGRAVCHDLQMRLLLDTASLYYRSYYAMPESMTAPNGTPNNMLRGFVATIDKLLTRLSPQEVFFCWDVDWRPQWRVDLLDSYKTHRVAHDQDAADIELVPDSLSPQISALAAILDAAGLARVGAQHFEADDVIATLASATTDPVLVVTGDRDLVQLVSNHVTVMLTVNGGMDKWPMLDPAQVVERFGVPSSLYVDLAALRGDASDGIPGVPGIGPKTAALLIAAYGDLEQILQAAEAPTLAKPMTPRLSSLLTQHADQARLAKSVSLARTDVPLTWKAPSTIGQASPDLTELLEAWGIEPQFTAMMQSLT